VRLEKRSAEPETEAGTSFGSIYFRQDQLHIDLFVFFSVFFSCFFLFLSVCVLVWKVKAVSDLRRARRRHAVEMQHMARRPFASQPVFIDHNRGDGFTAENFRHLPKGSKADFGAKKSHSHQRLLLHNNAVRDFGSSRLSHDVTDDSTPTLSRPLAFEPTFDGLAAVSTFLVQMPNCAVLEKANGQSLISFGCVLISTRCQSHQTFFFVIDAPAK
jgi:multipile epidermal growth factor-like domains protein 8